MNIEIGIGTAVIFALAISALQFLLSLWITERFKTSLQKEHSKYLEDLKWKQTIKSNALRISEYLSKAAFAEGLQTTEDFQKANQMTWELAMLLPADLYRTTVQSI